MTMRGFAVFVSMFAVFMSRSSVLLAFFMVAMIVFMGGLQVVVSRGLMMTRGRLMMLTGAMLLLFRHYKSPSSKRSARLRSKMPAWDSTTDVLDSNPEWSWKLCPRLPQQDFACEVVGDAPIRGAADDECFVDDYFFETSPSLSIVTVASLSLSRSDSVIV
jgi:hypothetical protein